MSAVGGVFGCRTQDLNSTINEKGQILVEATNKKGGSFMVLLLTPH